MAKTQQETEKERLAGRVLIFLRAPPRWFEWLVVGVLIIALVVLLSGQITGHSTEIKISILGQSMEITTGSDKVTIPVNVVVVDGVSYVRTASGDTPLRLWLEVQGYNVSWSQENQTVVAEKGT